MKKTRARANNAVKFALICLLCSLMFSAPAYSKKGCPDGLWKEYHSVLWDGPDRWYGQWTRVGCSNTWNVVWKNPVKRLTNSYQITMVRNGNTVTITSPYCRYVGNYSAYSERITGKHRCGSRGGTFTMNPGPGLIKR